MALNQKFPQISDTWAPLYGANTGAMPSVKWTELTSRTRHQTTIRRGRQYETDQVQAGEYTTTLDNTDGALDPLNASGPFFGAIKPYQPIRRYAQWSPTVNLLPQAIATGGDGWASGTSITANWPLVSDTDSTGGQTFIGTPGSAFEESSVFVYAVPSGTIDARVFSYDGQQVTPGQTYTFQVQVANVTASTSITLQAYIGWFLGAAGSVSTLTKGTVKTCTGGAAGYVNLTVTATAPANATGMRVGLRTQAGVTTTAAVSLWVDGLQVEKGSTASTWVYPGFWYSQFAGFVERWPSQYTDAGSRGEVTLTAVDAFALLSQTTLSDAFAEEVQYHTPRFYYPLSDAAGSTTFADASGNTQPLPVGVVKAGPGSITAGNSITATNLTTGVYVGSSGTVATISNGNPGTASIANSTASYLSLDAVGITGLGSLTNTRMWAVRWTGGTIAQFGIMWSQQSRPGWNFNVGIDSTGYLRANGTVGPDGNSDQTYSTGPKLNDGNWHLIHVVGLPADHVNQLPPGYQFWVDGVNVGSWLGTGQIIADFDSYGGEIDRLNNLSGYNFKGDMSCLAEFPTPLSSTDIGNMYTAWRNACVGDTTGARYSRILRYSGYTGNTWVDTGNTSSMGPADFSGSDVVSALQAVVDTESGSHHVRQTGTIRFVSRASRYNALTPKLTFGENTAGGEIPYEELQLDYDATHLANIVQVTQTSTGQVFTAQDATSIANYFPRTMTRSVNTTNALECQDCANYLLSRYKDPKVRITALKVNLSGYSSAWGSVLPLELGDRIRVMRRPMGAPAMQLDCFIEQMTWDFDSENGAFLTLQCSPADVTPYGLFAAFRSTIYGSVAQPAGTYGIPVGPMNGDNSQQLAAIIGHGQKIVIEPGTANAEVLTVDSVTATTPGSWSYGNLVCTTPTTLAHPAGAVVCEYLNGGITDPTTYDVSAKFDSTNFAY